MEGNQLVVFWKKMMLVIISGVPVRSQINTARILDWYAEKYLFERKELTGVWLDTVSYFEEEPK